VTPQYLILFMFFTTCIPNLMLLSQNAQFLWLRRPTNSNLAGQPLGPIEGLAGARLLHEIVALASSATTSRERGVLRRNYLRSANIPYPTKIAAAAQRWDCPRSCLHSKIILISELDSVSSVSELAWQFSGKDCSLP